MAELTTRIPIQSVTKEMVMQVDVTGLRLFSLRVMVAGWLIRLAAWIAGFGIEFVGEPKQNVINVTVNGSLIQESELQKMIIRSIEEAKRQGRA